MNSLRLASQAIKNSSETRVNLLAGRSCLAISTACFLHLDTQISLKVALARVDRSVVSAWVLLMMLVIMSDNGLFMLPI